MLSTNPLAAAAGESKRRKKREKYMATIKLGGLDRGTSSCRTSITYTTHRIDLFIMFHAIRSCLISFFFLPRLACASVCVVQFIYIVYIYTRISRIIFCCSLYVRCDLMRVLIHNFLFFYISYFFFSYIKPTCAYLFPPQHVIFSIYLCLYVMYLVR